MTGRLPVKSLAEKKAGPGPMGRRQRGSLLGEAHGFTLIEIIMVLVLIGIMGTAAGMGIAAITNKTTPIFRKTG